MLAENKKRSYSDAVDKCVSCLSTEVFHLLVAWKRLLTGCKPGLYGSRQKIKENILSVGWLQLKMEKKAVQVSISTTLSSS